MAICRGQHADLPAPQERAQAFRADPEVQAAMQASGWGELAEPTIGPGETYRDLPAVADVNADKLAERGYGYVKLDQLAIEHILGARQPCRSSRESTRRLQSCKVVIRDVASGAVVRVGRAPHPDGTEVDPDAWWDALQRAIRDAGGLADVAAIGIGGQQHGMVCLDAQGAVVRPALLWNDTRSAAAAQALVDELGANRWAQAVGSVPVAAFTVSKLAWLATHEPAEIARTAAVCLPTTGSRGAYSERASTPDDGSRRCQRHRLLVSGDR